jgi:hypothetical protein
MRASHRPLANDLFNGIGEIVLPLASAGADDLSRPLVKKAAFFHR